MAHLEKRLEARHINMIAIGGSIGTGIFLTSGNSINTAGPGGALLAYALISVIVYFLMTSLGEMSTYKPSSGSFCEYSATYVSPSFGFAMSVNYWFNWAITIAAEISAATTVISFWFPHMNPNIFLFGLYFLIFFANIFSVKVYGETEYWLSFIKVAVIIVFILLGFLTVFQQPNLGIHNWHVGDAPFHKGWLGFVSVFLFAGFSFQGTELVGVASGETKEPERAIPRAIKMVFWRLTLFYILSIGVITLLLPYNDPMLADTSGSLKASPYTLIFSKFLGSGAADIMNLVILLAIVSAANASMYSASRILWYMGQRGEVPSLFKRVNSRGVPMPALIATALVGALVFVSSFVGNGVFFNYIVQVSSLCGFIAWFGIALSHYMFRKRYLPALGGTSILKFKAKFYPFAQVVSMLVIAYVVIAQYQTLPDNSKFLDFIMTYASLLFFLLLYFGHKLFAKKE